MHPMLTALIFAPLYLSAHSISVDTLNIHNLYDTPKPKPTLTNAITLKSHKTRIHQMRNCKQEITRTPNQGDGLLQASNKLVLPLYTFKSKTALTTYESPYHLVYAPSWPNTYAHTPIDTPNLLNGRIKKLIPLQIIKVILKQAIDLYLK